MKYFLLIGGFFGFLIVFASGIAAGNELGAALRNASIGCVCGALLMRGFRALLAHQLRQLATQQAEARETSPVPASQD
jgi:hypothetical protein